MEKKGLSGPGPDLVKAQRWTALVPKGGSEQLEGTEPPSESPFHVSLQ